MDSIKLERSAYSEWVVRNALYWMSAITQWNLESSEKYWVILIKNSDTEIRQELDRLLNDYTLREQLMLKTENVRNSIIESVLSSVEARLRK